VLSVLLILVALIDITQIYFIRSIVFVSGLILAFLVGIYFLVQQRISFLKELLGTLLYSGGVLLIPLSVSNQWNFPIVLLMLQFGIIVFINLLLFSWFDKPKDEKDQQRSFATTFGLVITKRILVGLFVLAGVLTVVQIIFWFDMNAILILTLMTVSLLIIFLKKDYFEKEDRYRLLGDAVFLFPLIYLLF
jgi:4-hydroxybenzoate polyprenyltransferase